MIREESLEEWKADTLRWHGRELPNGPTAHWCMDWDDLPIDDSCDEFQSCTCCKECLAGTCKKAFKPTYFGPHE